MYVPFSMVIFNMQSKFTVDQVANKINVVDKMLYPAYRTLV